MKFLCAFLLLGCASSAYAEACYNFVNNTAGRPRLDFQYPAGLIGEHVASITLNPNGQYRFCDSAKIYKNGKYVRALLTGGRWGNNNGGPSMGSDSGASPAGDYTIINDQAPQIVEGPGEWYGFSNANSSIRDREPELHQRCSPSFSRIPTSGDAHQNVKFTDLCSSIGKQCVKVCDWEGHTQNCDDVSQWDNQYGGGRIGKRDGSRIALCQ